MTTVLGVMATISGCIGTPAGDPSVDESRDLLGDATTMRYSLSHGPQISYRTKDGQVFLWYPGNTVVLPGRWFVRESNKIRVAGMSDNKPEFLNQNFICFQYGSGTYNPVTGNAGGSGECVRTGFFQRSISAIRRGDVFGLSTRQEVPFVLSKSPTSFDSLVQQMPSAR